MMTLPSAQTAVRSASCGFSCWTFPSDDETGETLDNEAICKRVGDLAAQHDPRHLVVDHERAPALPLATGHESSLIDSEAHRPAFRVEEACIDGDDTSVGRDDLFDGAPRRWATSGD